MSSSQYRVVERCCETTIEAQPITYPHSVIQRHQIPESRGEVAEAHLVLVVSLQFLQRLHLNLVQKNGIGVREVLYVA